MLKPKKETVKKPAYKSTFKQTGQGLFNKDIKQYTKTQVKQVGDKTIKNTTSFDINTKTGKPGNDSKKNTTVVINNKKGVYTKKAGYTKQQHSGLVGPYYTKGSDKSISYKKK